MSSPEASPRPILFEIQYLRAFAACGVVAYHCGVAAGLPFHKGALGVDVFFVISGFLMVAITGGASRPWPFFRDRLVRVVPLYWTATAAALAFYALQSGGGRPPAAEIAASFLFLPWGDPGLDARFFPVLEVGWTLNYEMLFYGLFAIALFFPRRMQLWLLTAWFLLLLLAGHRLGAASAPLGFWGRPIILEFLAGCWLAWGWRRFEGSGGAMAALCAGALAAWIAVNIHPALRGGQAGPLTISLAIVAAALALHARRKGARPLRPLLLLGDASYSIYLWHLFGVAAVAATARALGGSLPPIALFAGAFVAGVMAGVLAHLLLERPLLRSFRSRPWRRGAPVPGGH